MYANENIYNTYGKTKTHSWRLHDLVALLYIGYTLIGSTNNDFLYVGLGILAVWFFVALLANPSALEASLKNSQVACMLFVAFYIVITGFSVAGWVFIFKQAVAAVMQFSYIIILGYYLQPSQSAKLNTIFNIVLLVFIGVEVKTLIFYSQHEGAARDLAKYQGYYGDLYGVGGYALAYAAALLGVIALNLLLDKRIISNFKKILWLAVLVFSTFVVIATESTITLIAYTIGLAVCIFFRNYNRPKDYLADPRLATAIKIVFLAVLFFLMVPFLKFFGELLIDISTNFSESLGKRISQLGYALIGDSKEGNYALDRMAIPIESFKTFLQSPIIGVGYKHGHGFLKQTLFGAGNHCEWVDALTNYGIIGGIPYLAIFVTQIKRIMKISSGLSVAWVVCLVIMGFFNPFRTFISHIVLFFLLPTLAFLLNQQEKIGEEEII